MKRRQFLQSPLLALAATGTAWPGAAAADNIRSYNLRPAPTTVNVVGRRWGDTDVWAYNGRVPGPVIRAVQGETLVARVDNGLPEPTTVHWHGIRLPHGMDGVPHLTQAAIAPGASFEYRFPLEDAGTYWYHPHASSSEQLGRGLTGALIVEEREPIRIDRELLWVLDDWRLESDASVREDFGNLHDRSHAGRIGNTVTVNGGLAEPTPVLPGERLRLRLVNTANARVFGLNFGDLDVHVIATDGHPVEPHRPPAGRVTLGPGMRADLLIDVNLSPDQQAAVVDDFYRSRAYTLTEFTAVGTPVRDQAPDWSRALPANPLSVPVLDDAIRHELVFTGGARGGMHGAELDGEYLDLRELARRGKFWALNEVVAHHHHMPPLLTARLGQTVVLDMENRTSWHHPIHLHGHVFQVLGRDGEAATPVEWRDTVLMNPLERVRIAFVADNPGDWMFHCHVLEHQEAGMMGVVRVEA
ncbi:FtsP/CotA-like multicopper oxidase with cupredoxin domain [Natronocella acetinitrilica]|uniref:FtsP/CotA-like multicopper oxidase with cupredoxin domain n=1 Tax=Natronocella acetinitrilica TaxID=414046 RepID=A0AAE3KCT3_9GAMM|nr:multicopper oxidase family protein [Natronocella acetinitrilica]MCP1675393.1 FtsP/CotA-like multicopper oxidase with cupredoxin domain [Natronocella acetinitrilica]